MRRLTPKAQTLDTRYTVVDAWERQDIGERPPLAWEGALQLDLELGLEAWGECGPRRQATFWDSGLSPAE